MKLLCLVTLLVCAGAQAATLNNEAFPMEDTVEKRLENTHVALNLVGKDGDVAEAPELTTALKAENRNVVTDAIEGLLEEIRDVIINGNDDLPPLDPLVVDVIGPLDYDASGVRGEITINNLNIDGLRWFVVDDISFNPLRLSFGIHITVPWITVTGSYDARTRVGFLTHRAGGNFRVFAHRIEVGVDLRLGTNLFGGHLVLRELDIKIDIHDTHIQITGMTGSNLVNGFISNMVQNISQDLIQSEMENVSNLLSEELFDVINDVLKDYTLADILG
ncbi:uncharacterized protein LOC113492752 [Trichoplusia ni]|uniref:Uncharacterized protein LOC113492752 n=1 Tax=Trichoplusia ni TaxID=7111 RepID=A0A7E5VD50_TRINI|nr:uncharacterized protein LOC113492752 [Trichoplusia ni]